MKSVLVTGASTGIGWASAHVLAEHGLNVYASVRKQSDADRLLESLGEKVTPLIFDVSDPDAIAAGAARVRDELAGKNLAGLVNNAGIAVAGPLMHMPIDDFRNQLEINLVGMLMVTQASLPLLGTDPDRHDVPGRIVNISSVGGKIGGPFLGAYSSSKFGVEGFSHSLRRELMLYEIDVIIVAPGAIATPIWDKAQEVDETPFLGTDYADSAIAFRDSMVADGRKGLAAEVVGEVIFEALTIDNPKTRYAVVKNPLVNWTIPRLLPDRMVDQVIAATLGWTPKNAQGLMPKIAKQLGSRGAS